MKLKVKLCSSPLRRRGCRRGSLLGFLVLAGEQNKKVAAEAVAPQYLAGSFTSKNSETHDGNEDKYSADKPFNYYSGVETEYTGTDGWNAETQNGYLCVNNKVTGEGSNPDRPGWWSTQFTDAQARYVSTVEIMPRWHSQAFIDQHGAAGAFRVDGACMRLQREGQGEPSSAAPDDAPCDHILPTKGEDKSAMIVSVNEKIVGFKIITASSDNHLIFCGVTVYGPPVDQIMEEAEMMDPSEITATQSSTHAEGEAVQALTFPAEGGSTDWATRKCTHTAGAEDTEDSWTATFAVPTKVRVMRLFRRSGYPQRLNFGRVFLDDDTEMFGRLPEISADGNVGTTLLIDQTVRKITIKDSNFSDSHGALNICGAHFYQNKKVAAEAVAPQYLAGSFTSKNSETHDGNEDKYSADKPFNYYSGVETEYTGTDGWNAETQNGYLCVNNKVTGEGSNPDRPGWWSTQFTDAQARYVSTVEIMPRWHSQAFIDQHGAAGAFRVDGACMRLQREGQGEPSSAAPDDAPCDHILPTKGEDKSAMIVSVNEKIVGFKIITASSDNHLIFCGVTVYGPPVDQIMEEAEMMDPSEITATQSSTHAEGEAVQALTFPAEGGSTDWATRKCTHTAGADDTEDSWTATFAVPTKVRVMRLFRRSGYPQRLNFGRVFLDDDTEMFGRLPEISADGNVGTTLLIDQTVRKITIKDSNFSDSHGALNICGAHFYQNKKVAAQAVAPQYLAGSFTSKNSETHDGNEDKYSADKPFNYYSGVETEYTGTDGWNAETQNGYLCVNNKVTGEGSDPDRPGWWSTQFTDAQARYVSNVKIMPRWHSQAFINQHGAAGAFRVDGACMRLQREGEGEPSSAAPDDAPCDHILPTKGEDKSAMIVSVNEKIVGFKIITASSDNHLIFCGVTVYGPVLRDEFVFDFDRFDPEACRAWAEQHTALEIGGAGYDFEGDYGTKGLYAYKTGTYAGRCYFGTGGSQGEMDAAPNADQYRPHFVLNSFKVLRDEFVQDVDRFDPAACRAWAEQHTALKIGGAGYDFEGDYGTKGLYAYKTGEYAGRVYFGTGGSQGEMDAAPRADQYRPHFDKVAEMMDPDRETREITATQSSSHAEGEAVQALTFPAEGGSTDWATRKCTDSEDSWTATFAVPTKVRAMRLFRRSGYARRLNFGRVFLDDNTEMFGRLPEISADGNVGTTLLIDQMVRKITIKDSNFSDSDGYLNICGAHFYQDVTPPTAREIALKNGVLSLTTSVALNPGVVDIMSEKEVAATAFKVATAKLSSLVKSLTL